MKNICLSNLQYLLLALLVTAMTGCGANNSALTPGGGVGAVQAQVVFPKNTAKSSAKMLTSVVPVGVGSLKLTVTGTSSDGINPVPVVRSTMANLTPGSSQASASVTGIYPGRVTLAVQAMSNQDGTGTVVWEGYAIGVVVASGTQSNAGTINMSTPVDKPENDTCIACHETILDATGQNLVADYKQSGHYTNTNVYPTTVDGSGQAGAGATMTGCAGCHGISHNDASPSSSGRCYKCHGFLVASHQGNAALIQQNNCTTCHQAHNTNAFVGGRCISCHSVGQNVAGTAGAGSYVNDNSGVRVITTEFTKNAHHVVGKALTDADCAVCHLEGQKGGILNDAYHMKDNTVHLRNCNPALVGNQSHANLNNPAEYVWNPASPDQTAMDQFCMSCHNAGGAPAAFGIVSSAVLANGIGGRNTATNPFADTISNGYDQMQRPAVVDVFDQFDTGNTSHHAVRGQKYLTKQRADAISVANGGNGILNGSAAANVFNQYSGAVQGSVHPHLTGSNTTTPVVWQYFGSYSTAYGSNSGPGPVTPGSRKTLYEAQLFAAGYQTLDGAALADNVTLHCGDCHTVGQWTSGSSVNAAGQATTVVIGAHGSANEYLLRNSLGTDALHSVQAATYTSGTAPTFVNGQATNISTAGQTYVCFLCHRADAYQGTLTYFQYTDPLTGATSAKMHDGIDPGQCNNYNHSSAGQVGYTNRVGALSAGLHSVFGMTCTNCHSSGNQVFGGIHGNGNYGTQSAYKTYSTNGMDLQTNVLAGAAGVLGGTGASEHRNTQLNITSRAPYRFMGGTSLKYSGGGNAAMWEKKALNGSPHREGCYNLSVDTTGSQAWSTAAEGSALINSNYTAPGTANALPTIANGVADDTAASSNGTAIGNVAAAQNGVSSGWGSCNHHNPSNIKGGTSPSRTVQRPLVY